MNIRIIIKLNNKGGIIMNNKDLLDKSCITNSPSIGG